MANIIWIMREIPTPVNSGDRLYTRGLLENLADAGHDISVLALADPTGSPPDFSKLPSNVDWRLVPGLPNSRVSSLFSFMPLIAKRFDTASNRQALRQELDKGAADVVVLDNYSSAWALSRLRGRPEMIAIIAHDFETRVTLDIYKAYSGNPLKKLALLLNALKTRWAEHRLVRAADLVVTITEEDSLHFRAMNARSITTVTPGYVGLPSDRHIDDSTERRVVLFGSYNWVAKQLNLRSFLEAADARFFECGIKLDVVGSLPPALQAELQPTLRATKIWGFVEDPAPIFRAARLGVVPELTGGGFKLKTLDYIFAGLPVFGLATALKGLPQQVRRHMLVSDDMSGLVDAICGTINDTQHLDDLRREALAAAALAFDWPSRGRQLGAAICESLEKHRERSSHSGRRKLTRKPSAGLQGLDF